MVLRRDLAGFDKELMIGELQTHVKTITAPYKYPRKVSSLINDIKIPQYYGTTAVLLQYYYDNTVLLYYSSTVL